MKKKQKYKNIPRQSSSFHYIGQCNIIGPHIILPFAKPQDTTKNTASMQSNSHVEIYFSCLCHRSKSKDMTIQLQSTQHKLKHNKYKFKRLFINLATTRLQFQDLLCENLNRYYKQTKDNISKHKSYISKLQKSMPQTLLLCRCACNTVSCVSCSSAGTSIQQ